MIKDIVRKFTTLVRTKATSFNIIIFISTKIAFKDRKDLVLSS